MHDNNNAERTRNRWRVLFLCSKIRSKKSDDNSDFFYGLFPKIHFFKNHVKSMILTRDTTAKSQRNCEIVFIDFFKIEW